MFKAFIVGIGLIVVASTPVLATVNTAFARPDCGRGTSGLGLSGRRALRLVPKAEIILRSGRALARGL